MIVGTVGYCGTVVGAVSNEVEREGECEAVGRAEEEVASQILVQVHEPIIEN